MQKLCVVSADLLQKLCRISADFLKTLCRSSAEKLSGQERARRTDGPRLTDRGGRTARNAPQNHQKQPKMCQFTICGGVHARITKTDQKACQYTCFGKLSGSRSRRIEKRSGQDRATKTPKTTKNVSVYGIGGGQRMDHQN